MDSEVLVIEMPELDDETVEVMYNFLLDFLNGFGAHYYHRLQRRHQEALLEDRRGD